MLTKLCVKWLYEANIFKKFKHVSKLYMSAPCCESYFLVWCYFNQSQP